MIFNANSNGQSGLSVTGKLGGVISQVTHVNPFHRPPTTQQVQSTIKSSNTDVIRLEESESDKEEEMSFFLKSGSTNKKLSNTAASQLKSSVNKTSFNLETKPDDVARDPRKKLKKK